MNALTFRIATSEDLPALKILVESAYRGDAARGGWTHEADLLDGERISAQELAETIANPAQRVILAERNDELVGCVAVTDLMHRAYLGMLCVSPALQASGVGRALINEAEAQAHDAFGAEVMELTVISRREELIAWYERRGYAKSSETRPFPYPGGEGLVMSVLERPLS